MQMIHWLSNVSAQNYVLVKARKIQNNFFQFKDILVPNVIIFWRNKHFVCFHFHVSFSVNAPLTCLLSVFEKNDQNIRINCWF